MALNLIRKGSTARLADVNPAAIEHYKQMRATLTTAPDVDPAICETVFAMQLALLGHEVPFKIHAARALAAGVTKRRLQSLIMAGVGVTTLAFEAARALEWLDQAESTLKQAHC
jgi:alkylhydroperoxidase/carboxymuconolactone decarboxylase family protein YurZ